MSGLDESTARQLFCSVSKGDHVDTERYLAQSGRRNVHERAIRRIAPFI
jgi:hypothetical protein